MPYELREGNLNYYNTKQKGCDNANLTRECDTKFADLITQEKEQAVKLNAESLIFVTSVKIIFQGILCIADYLSLYGCGFSLSLCG